nr:PKD domain-containing protein [Phycicoccus endophyticus]
MYRVSFSGGVVSGSPTLVNGPSTGGVDWRGRALFLGNPPANERPTATFTSLCTDLECSFDGSGSADSDGSIVSYDWSFGDGATSTDPAPSHTYAADGSYEVSLTVTDDRGARARRPGPCRRPRRRPTRGSSGRTPRTPASRRTRR